MKSLNSPGFLRSRAHWLGAGLAATFLLLGGTASAQERFGTKGQLAITAENLFALSSEKVTQPGPLGDESQTSNRFGILFSSRGGGDNDIFSPHGPMVGGHYFVIPSLSVGGTIGFESHGGSNSLRGVSTDRGTVSSFVLLPKVGYALMLNDTIGFWFRGGPGFMRAGSSGGTGTDSRSASVWTLGADALLVVTPVRHFGFYVGPQGEISFTGSSTTTMGNGVSSSRDLSYQSLAVSVGMLGYFGL